MGTPTVKVLAASILSMSRKGISSMRAAALRGLSDVDSLLATTLAHPDAQRPLAADGIATTRVLLPRDG